MDNQPMIRDYLRQMIEERGQSVRQAEIAMGLPSGQLHSFLHSGILCFGERRGTLLAAYLGLEWAEVRRWMRRDEGRIRQQRAQAKGDLRPSGPVRTWWGVLNRPLVLAPYRGCNACHMEEICRLLVRMGLPLACERLLERELVPAGH